jgi:hypothetical protein
MSGINREAWVKALAAVEQPDNPDAITVSEFAAMLGLTRDAAHTRMRKLLAAGKAKQVATKRIIDASGRPQRAPAYELIEESK